MATSEFTAGGNPAMDWHPIQGGVEILLVTSCYRNQDKLWPAGPLGSHADLITYSTQNSIWIRDLHYLLLLQYRYST